MEPRFSIETASNRLGISTPYFRKLLRKTGLEPIRIGKNVFYEKKHIEAVHVLLEEERKGIYLAAKNRMKVFLKV